MATRISGASLQVKLDQPHITKTGQIDRRYKLSGTITNKNLRNIIQGEVANVIKDLDSLGASTQKSDNVKSNNSSSGNARSKGRSWRTSVMGLSILGRNVFSTTMHIAENVASTDSVALQKSIVNGAVSTSISTIGTFGGPTGAVIATLMSTAWYLGGNRVNNAIQRAGDKRRLAYSFANYDAYKYGTYCYDNSSGEWVAEDAEKVQKRILGKKVSV